MQTRVSLYRSILVGLFLICAGGLAVGETFKLANGETITGEMLLASANDAGVQIKVGEGKYEKITWSSLSQDDLKRLAENKKLEPFVEPFIEVSPSERAKRVEVDVKQPPRLERPAQQSLFGALFSTGLGIFLLFAIYAANIYAGYEIAIFRAQPAALVCGVAAVAPILGPIVFLALPTRIKPGEEEAAAAVAAEGEPAAAGAGGEGDVNPMLADGAAHPSGLKLAESLAPQKPHHPSTTYQRGQFTFNRRFFETKFVNFFGPVRREADRDMILVFKTPRANHVTTRISRIAANDLHLEVHHGGKTEEVLVPFQEIQEVTLKHKDAP